MIRPDEHARMAEERHRARDIEREPGARFCRTLDDLARRRRLQASVVDGVNIAKTAIVPLQCPQCLATLFAPAESNGEHLDCIECEARLVTHSTSDGDLTAPTHRRERGPVVIVVEHHQHIALTNCWLAGLYDCAGQGGIVEAFVRGLSAYLAQYQGIRIGAAS